MQVIERRKRKAIKKDKTETQKSLDEFQKSFDLLADELRDFNPEAFDHLRDNFFSFMGHSFFKENCCDKWLLKGKSPVREWLKVNGYPTADEVAILTLMRSLTNESKKAYVVLLRRYFFIYDNSAAYRKKCDDQNNAGINPFGAWMKKQGFEPVFRVDRTA